MNQLSSTRPLPPDPPPISDTPEIETADVEVMTDQTGLSTHLAAEKSSGVFDMDITALEALANEAERRVASYKKIRTALLGMALPGDWQAFGQAGKQYLELTSAGTERYKAPFGIGVPPERIKVQRITGKDDAGEWFRYEVTCVIVWKGIEQIGFGFAGSRDKFFGMKDSQWKPASELRETDIKQAAIRAAQKEGIKQLFGLRRIPTENASDLGLPTNVVRGHTFPEGGRMKDEGGMRSRPTAGVAGAHSAAKAADTEYQSASGKIAAVNTKGKVTFLVLDDDSEYRAFTDKRDIWAAVAKLYQAQAVVTVDYTVHPQYGRQILRVEEKAGSKDEGGVGRDEPPARPNSESQASGRPGGSSLPDLDAEWNACNAEERWSVVGDNELEDIKTWPKEKQAAAAFALRKEREKRK